MIDRDRETDADRWTQRETEKTLMMNIGCVTGKAKGGGRNWKNAREGWRWCLEDLKSTTPKLPMQGGLGMVCKRVGCKPKFDLIPFPQRLHISELHSYEIFSIFPLWFWFLVHSRFFREIVYFKQNSCYSLKISHFQIFSKFSIFKNSQTETCANIQYVHAKQTGQMRAPKWRSQRREQFPARATERERERYIYICCRVNNLGHLLAKVGSITWPPLGQ